MGRHEIRLRRKKMTSRRVEAYKNYYDIMRRHNKHVHRKRLVKTLLYILFFLGLAVMLYFGMDVLSRSEKENISGRNISNVELNFNNNGKEKEPPERCIPVDPRMV